MISFEEYFAAQKHIDAVRDINHRNDRAERYIEKTERKWRRKQAVYYVAAVLMAVLIFAALVLTGVIA